MSAWVSKALYHFIPLHPSTISNWEVVHRTLITFSKVAGWKSIRFWKTLRVRCAGTHSSIIHDSGRTFRAGISKLPPGVNVPCTLNKSRNQCPRLQPLCFQMTETAVGNQIWHLNHCRSLAWLWESLLRVTSGGAVGRGREWCMEVAVVCVCSCRKNQNLKAGPVLKLSGVPLKALKVGRKSLPGEKS